MTLIDRLLRYGLFAAFGWQMVQAAYFDHTVADVRYHLTLGGLTLIMIGVVAVLDRQRDLHRLLARQNEIVASALQAQIDALRQVAARDRV